MRALKGAGLPAYVGPSWTTDAPFRETAAAVAAARAKGLLAVEMEAAALYMLARARNKAVPIYFSRAPTPSLCTPGRRRQSSNIGDVADWAGSTGVAAPIFG